MHVTIDRIISALGGHQYIRRNVETPFDLIELVREGIPIESVAYLQKNLGFTNKTMSHILAISESTYQHRLRSKAQLTQDETEKAISLSEVYEKGIEVFSDKLRFGQWLNASIPTLMSQRPIDLLDSMVGRKKVIDLLNALIHGIYM